MLGVAAAAPGRVAHRGRSVHAHVGHRLRRALAEQPQLEVRRLRLLARAKRTAPSRSLCQVASAASTAST